MALAGNNSGRGVESTGNCPFSDRKRYKTKIMYHYKEFFLDLITLFCPSAVGIHLICRLMGMYDCSSGVGRICLPSSVVKAKLRLQSGSWPWSPQKLRL